MYLPSVLVLLSARSAFQTHQGQQKKVQGCYHDYSCLSDAVNFGHSQSPLLSRDKTDKFVYHVCEVAETYSKLLLVSI